MFRRAHCCASTSRLPCASLAGRIQAIRNEKITTIEITIGIARNGPSTSLGGDAIKFRGTLNNAASVVGDQLYAFGIVRIRIPWAAIIRSRGQGDITMKAVDQVSQKEC